MPDYYASRQYLDAPRPTFDFTAGPAPAAIFINLGTNDLSVIPSLPNGMARFASALLEFMKNATALYNKPDIEFFLSAGPMENATMPGTLSAVDLAIQQGLKATFVDLRTGCSSASSHQKDNSNMCDGCAGHPGLAGHRRMFELAAPVMAHVMGWNARKRGRLPPAPSPRAKTAARRELAPLRASAAPPTPDTMKAAVSHFVQHVQPTSFDLHESVRYFAPQLTWSFPPSGSPRQVTREGFVAHMQSGYNGTLAWSSQVRRMHVAGLTLVAQVNDFYMMASGRLCNWPNVYWRARFDAHSGLISTWEDLIPYDGPPGSCAGAPNTSAIAQSFTARWAALSAYNVSAFLAVHADDAQTSYEIGGDGPDPVPAPAGTCDNSCTRRYVSALLSSVELFSALPTEFCVHGERVTYALDMMGYPTHVQPVPADGRNALLRRGVAMAVVRPRSGRAGLEIVSEHLVMERFVPHPP